MSSLPSLSPVGTMLKPPAANGQPLRKYGSAMALGPSRTHPRDAHNLTATSTVFPPPPPPNDPSQLHGAAQPQTMIGNLFASTRRTRRMSADAALLDTAQTPPSHLQGRTALTPKNLCRPSPTQSPTHFERRGQSFTSVKEAMKTKANNSSQSKRRASNLQRPRYFRFHDAPVDLSNCRYDVIRHVFEYMFGMEVLAFNTVASTSAATDMMSGASVYWSDRSLAPMRVHKLVASRCVANHFPSIEALCRKVSMGKLLTAMRQAFPELYHFFPRTFVTYEEFVVGMSSDSKVSMEPNDSARASRDNARGSEQPKYYICKPNGGCCGRDITITSKVTPWMFDGVARASRIDGEVVSSSVTVDPCVVQEYIHRPLLVNGRKCDLRCYVLVTSLEPLVVYFYKEGIVRLCGTQYETPNDSNINIHSMHLANYAVNKKVSSSSSIKQAPNSSDVEDGDDGGEEFVEEAHGELSHRSSNEPLMRPLPPPVAAMSTATSGTALKQTFEYYNRFLLQHIQRSPQLLELADREYAAQNGRRATSVPHVLLATFLLERLWTSIHEIAVKSVLSAYKVLHKSLPPSSLTTSSHLFSCPPTPAQGKRKSTPSETNPSNGPSPRSTPQKPSPSSFTCFAQNASAQSPFFELLGFDILVDENMKPWLIEINHSPSWGADTTFDFELKRRVLRDALQISLLPRLAGKKKGGGLNEVDRRNDSSSGGTEFDPNDDVEEEYGLFRNGTRRTDSYTAEIQKKAEQWKLADEEYASEGNRFHLVFPSVSMQAKLSDVLASQGIRTVRED